MSIINRLKLPSYDRRLWILFFGMALNQFGMSIVMPFISIYLFIIRVYQRASWAWPCSSPPS